MILFCTENDRVSSNNTQDTIQLMTTNFFVKYKSTLGNYKYIAKISFLLWFISSVGAFFLIPPYEVTETTQILFIKHLAQITSISIPVILIIAIRCKTPKFNDQLLIRTEFKYLLINISLCLFINLLVEFISVFCLRVISLTFGVLTRAIICMYVQYFPTNGLAFH